MAELKMSESEEMYLITIAKLGERGVEGPVPVAMLAEELAVLPVSANQMIHKLENDGAVEYVPYKGVSLQPEGRRLAERTLRKRRLWELFLVERLGLAFEEADRLACRMEHISSGEVTEQLAEYLGHPQYSSQGAPIPAAERHGSGEEQAPGRPLSEAEPGREYRVVQITDATLKDYLGMQSVTEGGRVSLLATSSQGLVMLAVGETYLNVVSEMAEQIRVTGVVAKEQDIEQ